MPIVSYSSIQYVGNEQNSEKQKHVGSDSEQRGSGAAIFTSTDVQKYRSVLSEEPAGTESVECDMFCRQ